ncbi:5-methylthioadenosine/S-adenosylhomocysteine deaminase [Streptosporangium violaceochromogenes]|nr:5-methylthioadenosine/S-adenosylhomocysteine deaminase [Streptosporangium violaceochromogenes]
MRIYHGAAVVTGRLTGDVHEVVERGGVAVDGERVVAVAPLTDLRDRFPRAEEAGGPDRLIMPGFVDGHHHQGVAPIRLGARAMSLERVFTHRRILRGPALYEDTLYGAAEMLGAGITTVNHLHVGRRGPWERWRDDAETVIRAYRDAGMRVNFTFNFRDQNRLVYDGDGWFSARLPEPLAGEMREFLGGQEVPLSSYLDELFVGLWEAGGGNTGPHARVSLAPHNLHWCSDDAIRSIMEVAGEYGVHVNMHLLESPRQDLYARTRTGGSAVAHLRDLGVLGENLTLLHAVWTTEDDIALLAEARTRVCASVSSNLLMGSGVAPLNLMRERGVPLSLGLDEGGLNSDWDVFADMRLVQGLQHTPGAEDEVITPGVLLAMATGGAAASTEFRGEIGSLEPGRYADLLVLDWERLNAPVGPTGPAVVDDLVYKAARSHIRSVVVGGREVVRDGTHVTVDKDEVGAEIHRQLSAPPSHQDERRLATLRRVLPYVDAYWDGYGRSPDGRPRYGPRGCA